MSKEILERILTETLAPFLAMSDQEVEVHLKHVNLSIKERLTTIQGLQVIIYPNDHLPPHFHVKTKDGRVDAKFKIEDCSYIKGSISNSDLRKIEAFGKSSKGQIALNTVWRKYHS